ncbi:hypothetical protein GLAREA_09916 [Glarea lozoyensis ATCC 20868]|uniref:Uncharacterized protein n=1 Tax=Glarea lozoyensis (strain ATCC 20868 / MF5171) TaxID=1116229 RepID=S3CT44_GLAL2|nr:uncharacterized protein GLAREA_09916 [Glarea lozoyensis ATCC 20868]EPE28795.1 hypothetical protein GLAREA_09916 [Glarea lozoyensis ATCC 20868]
MLNAASLSGLETFRLARAFYRFDLFAHLSSHPRDSKVLETTMHLHVLAIHIGHTCLLDSLNDWELEEFLCVHKYVTEKGFEFLDRVEDDVLAECISNGLTAGSDTSPITDWANAHPEFSQADSPHINFLDSLLTRGLKYVREALAQDTPESRRRYHTENLKYIPSPEVYKLVDIIEKLPRFSTFSETELAAYHKANKPAIEDTQTSNPGFWTALKYYRDHQPIPGRHNFYHFQNLRQWGYAIWSQETLDRHRLPDDGSSMFLYNSGKQPMIAYACYQHTILNDVGLLNFSAGDVVHSTWRRGGNTVEGQLESMWNRENGERMEAS